MRALGWLLLLLIFAALTAAGVYGHWHYTGLVAARDGQRAKISELEAELERAQKERSELERSATEAQKNLKATHADLAELQQRRTDAERRLAMIKEVTAKLQQMIDTGKLGVVTREGRMIVQMPAEVLFESGSAELSKAGEATLRAVAKALRSELDRKLIVAGHTDNQRIGEAKFKSNWELSAARAVTVTELLVRAGLKPKNLVAAGFGEFHPLGDNRTAKGRQDNRRIEIEIQPPELDALPQIVQAVTDTATGAPASSAAP
jgi:chemotaxis protein MotB